MPYSHYRIEDGFVFVWGREFAHQHPVEIVIRNPKACRSWTPCYGYSEKSLEEHIRYINEHKITHATVFAEDLGFIAKCPTLTHINIHPADSAPENFNYSPLYQLPSIEYLSCVTGYGGSETPLQTTIDYSMFELSEIKSLRLSGKGHVNFNKIKSLEILNLSEDKTVKDFECLSELSGLKSIDFVQCGINSFKGVSRISGLQSVGISYCRSINDISEISSAAHSLRALHIENCPKIDDFSFLYDLAKLEYLSLFGKNIIPNVSFLKKMKKLKVFTFSMEIASCDLTPCLDIPYVWVAKGKKYYNLKDKDMSHEMPGEGFKLK